METSLCPLSVLLSVVCPVLEQESRLKVTRLIARLRHHRSLLGRCALRWLLLRIHALRRLPWLHRLRLRLVLLHPSGPVWCALVALKLLHGCEVARWCTLRSRPALSLCAAHLPPPLLVVVED